MDLQHSPITAVNVIKVTVLIVSWNINRDIVIKCTFVRKI